MMKKISLIGCIFAIFVHIFSPIFIYAATSSQYSIQDTINQSGGKSNSSKYQIQELIGDSAVHGSASKYSISNWIFGNQAISVIPSNEVAPDTGGQVNNVIIPDAPIAQSITQSGSSAILSWTDAAGTSSIIILRAIDPNPVSATIYATVSAGLGKFVDPNLIDGNTYKYIIRTKNAGGEISTNTNELSLAIDTIAPISSADTLNQYSTGAIISIPYTISESGTGVSVDLYYSFDNGNYTKYGNFNSSPISFDSAAISGDGFYQFYTTGIDSSGNIENKTQAAEANINIDTIFPTSLSLFIPSSSSGVSIPMIISATGASEMMISGDIVGQSTWIPYSTNQQITLSAADGDKNITVSFRDLAGNTKQIHGITTLDTIAPNITVLSLNNDTNPASAQSINISVTGDSDIYEIWIEGDVSDMSTTNKWIPWTSGSNTDIILSQSNGTKIIKVKARDKANNIGNVIIQNIDLVINLNLNTVTSGGYNISAMTGTNLIDILNLINGNTGSTVISSSGNDFLAAINTINTISTINTSSGGTSSTGIVTAIQSNEEKILAAATMSIQNGNTDIPLLITNWKTGDVSSDSSPLFRGIGIPGSNIEIWARGFDQIDQKIVTTTIDTEGKFAARPLSSLADDVYDIQLMIVDNDIVTKKSPILRIRISTKLNIPSPVIQLFDQLTYASINTDGEIVIYNNQPLVIGSTFYGSEVIATWQSIVSANSVIATGPGGEFKIQAPKKLEAGLHHLTLYSVIKETGERSKEMTLQFVVLPLGSTATGLTNMGQKKIIMIIAVIIMTTTMLTYLVNDRRKINID